MEICSLYKTVCDCHMWGKESEVFTIKTALQWKNERKKNVKSYYSF